MPDLIYILFILVLIYFFCIPRFEAFVSGDSTQPLTESFLDRPDQWPSRSHF